MPRLAITLLVTTFALSARAAPPSPSRAGLEDLKQIERLSLSLRNRPLSFHERTVLTSSISRRPFDQVYEELVDSWMVPDNLRGTIWGIIPADGLPLTTFFMALARFVDPADGAEVYYLPHQHAAAGIPCSAAERTRLRPWWSKQEIAVCDASHLPEVVFDQAGYCAGQTTPAEPQPPRPGCGCGPFLISCAPPEELAPEMHYGFRGMLAEEVIETALDVVMRGRPYDEIYTTTRTWQNGMVRFLYLRQQLLGLLRDKKYTPELEGELARRLEGVDPQAPGQLTIREGPFVGAGVYSSLTFSYALHRPAIVALFSNTLCTTFESVNVDSDALHRTFAAQDQIPHLGVAEWVATSPMRTQAGCKGCHAPLDNTAGFLEGAGSSIYGAMFTGRPGAGRLFLKGPEDFRGQGSGWAALMQLVLRQPERVPCVVRKTFASLTGRTLPAAHQRAELERLGAEFAEHRSLLKLIRAILLSGAYRRDGNGPHMSEDAGPPARVAELLNTHCTECHGAEAQAELDLRTPPPVADHARWFEILEMLESADAAAG